MVKLTKRVSKFTPKKFYEIDPSSYLKEKEISLLDVCLTRNEVLLISKNHGQCTYIASDALI